ncbi:MAG: DUF4367 domain-containing protein [Oscillochloridaceae bacterium umkhey_bin13]
MRWLKLMVVALLSALVLAACGPALPSAEEVVSRMEAARATTDDIHATVALDFTSPEQAGRVVVEGWAQQTDTLGPNGEPIMRVRAEVREASEPELVGMVAVSDGATFWLYSPSQATAITGAISEFKQAAHATPAGSAVMLTDLLAQGFDAVDMQVVGIETVAGKSTWKLEVTPKAETNAQLRLDQVIRGTLWVDEALALPLKLAVDASDFGQGTVEVQSIEVNSGLAADLFSFTPPAGTTIVQAADLAAQFERPEAATTVDEARSAVSFAVREPGYLPANTVLVEVRVVGTGTLIMNYSGPSGSFSLVQSNEEVGRDREPPAGSLVQPVSVAGVAGTLISGADGQGSFVRWEVDGLRYVVAGTLPADEALKVAEGLQ